MSRAHGGPSVLVVGEALMDVVDGPAGRVEHPGGSAANVALGLGRLGIPAELLTHLADDRRGRRIVEHLAASGAHVLDTSCTAARTSTALASIGPSGAARYEFDVSWALPATLPSSPVRLLHVGSLAAFLSPPQRLHDLIGAVAPRLVTFDPNIRPALVGEHAAAQERFEDVARRSSVVKLSDEDAAWLYPGASTTAVLDRLLGLGSTLAVVTRGADGAVLATRSHRIAVEAPRVLVVDTIGAGDTFMASVIRSVLEREDADLAFDELQVLARDAVEAAAVTASRAGADLPWRSEVRRPVDEATVPDPSQGRGHSSRDVLEHPSRSRRSTPLDE